MKRMLINATQQEELRMAMVDGQRLYDLNIEAPSSERKKANIYKGKITRIEPSLEAAFVDYGADRHGFLPLKEISSEYFIKDIKGGKPNIKDVLKEGQDIVVQVDKEERGNKGAALTTFVSLAGRFIVLKPNKARSGGVSRRITGDDRDLARKSLNDIEIPDDMSVILRTAGIGRTPEELAWDLENLLTVWTAILNVVLERPSPFLIYRESDSVVRALRDYLTNDIGEILIDDEATYKDAYEHVEQTMPHNLKKLKHYVDPVPLFTRFQIESQIESAFAHVVHLPAGGSIVIDHTEALVSIDINSARATKGGDIEATALNTNLEAAEEIARQLRIRDLGGLIVIDFIDMGPQKNQRDVENRLREAVRQDRARVQIGKISRFGLLEMSRQRLRPSIGESSHQTCPRCTGFGTIRSVESLALAILRLVGEEARKERTAKVIAQLPVEVATYLLNEKRDWVQSLEDRNEIQIVLVANSLLETPHYEVRRVRDDQLELPENTGVSYALIDTKAEPESPQAILERKAIAPPAVATIKPSKPAPQREEPAPPKGKGLWGTLMSLFSSDDEGDQEDRQTRSRAGRGKPAARRSDSRRGSDKSGGPQRKKTQKKTAKKPTRKKAAKTGARKKQPQDEPQQQDRQAQPQSDESGNEPKRTRNRRSRGGRRRRRAADKPAETGDAQQQSADSQQQDRGKSQPEPTPKAEGAAQAESKSSPATQDKKKPVKEATTKAAADESTETGKVATESKPKSAPEADKRVPADDQASAEKGAAGSKPKRKRAKKKATKKSDAGTDSGPSPDQRPGDKGQAAAEPEAAPKPEKPAQQPSQDGNGSDRQAAPRLLPWEPQSPAEIKPASKSAKPQTAPTPRAAADKEAVKDAKPDDAPAPPAADKPGNPSAGTTQD